MKKAIGRALIVLIIFILFISAAYFRHAWRKYKDIGVTPFHTAEIETSADKSDKYTDEEINQAIEKVIEKADSEYIDEHWIWHDRNLYLTKVWYENDFYSEYRDIDEEKTGKQVIFIRCNLYHGECGNCCGYNAYCLYTAGYWKLTRDNENSEWECGNWGQY